MSIWGDADATEIPDDPFRIEPNWYEAVVAECYEKDLDAEQKIAQLVIKWKIQQIGGKFHNLPVTQKKTYYKRRDLDAEEMRANSFLKMLLRQGLDLTPEEINTFEPKMGFNKKAMIKVTNSPDKDNPEVIYSNVGAVVSKRSWDERKASNGGSNTEYDSGEVASSLLDY